MIKYSVVVPTHNRSAHITICLHALVRQSISPSLFEVIIVDDGSTDSTQSVIKSFIDSHPGWNISYIAQKHKGPAAAKNLGITQSKGEIIFFTDDDCEPPATWMEKILFVYDAHPDVVAVGGKFSAPKNLVHTNPYHQFRYLYPRFLWGNDYDFFEGKTGEKGKLPVVNGGNFSARRWILQRIGGFDERFPFAQEDVDLSERILATRFPLYYLPAEVLHHSEANLVNFIRYAWTRGRGWQIYLALRPYHRDKPAWPWTSQKNFMHFCRNLTKSHPSFRHHRRLFVTALLFYTIHFLARTLPISTPLIAGKMSS